MSSSGTTITPNKTSPPSGSVQGSTTTGTGSGATDAVLGTTPRTVPRSQGGFSECFSGIKKEERATLKGMELEKLKKRAEEGLPSKFVLMKLVLKGDRSVDIERLKTIYPVSLCLREFLQELRVYDMEEVFIRIPSVFRMKPGVGWVPSAGAQIKSLFDATHKPDLDSVRKTSYYMFDYGADYTV